MARPANALRIRKYLSISATLAGMLMTAAATAHPYDSPLEFRLHRTEDGRPIYSNIPKKCFRDGRLICHGLHPVFPTPASTMPERPEATN